MLLETQALATVIRHDFPQSAFTFQPWAHYPDLGGSSAVTPGIHRRPASRLCPQHARRASHHWSMCQNVQGHVHLMESPGFSAVGAGSKILFWWPNLGFNDSSLVCTCSCIGESATHVSMSMGLNIPYRASSFNCCSTVHMHRAPS